MKTLLLLVIVFFSGCESFNRLNPEYNTSPKFGWFGHQTANPAWSTQSEIRNYYEPRISKHSRR